MTIFLTEFSRTTILTLIMKNFILNKLVEACMTDQFDTLRNALPIAPLKIATLDGSRDFATKVNDHLV